MKTAVGFQRAIVLSHCRSHCSILFQHERRRGTATPKGAESTCSGKPTFVANLLSDNGIDGLIYSAGRKRQDRIESFEQQIKELNEEILWLRGCADLYQAQQPLPMWDTNILSAPPTDLGWPISCKVHFLIRS